MMSLARDGQKVLTETIHPHGFNIGINIGRCAGAGLPGHIHIHLIPRWDGDTNSMSVIARVRVISQSLDELYDQLTQTSKKLNLPTG
jgi:ATP adenylyltransferase